MAGAIYARKRVRAFLATGSGDFLEHATMSARVSIVRSGFIAIAAGLVVAAAGNASAAPPAFHGGGGFHGGFAGGYRGGYAPRGYWGGYRGGWYGGYYGWRGGWGYGCCGWGWGLGWVGLGVYLPVLPLGYATYWYGGVPYYYVNNTYYAWAPGVGQYEAVQPPAGFNGTATTAPPAGSGAQNYATGNGQWTDLFAYPKAGQSMEQQKRDRDECRQWAIQESGFDPSQPPGDPSSAAAKRDGYLRAETACLQGRNYSVK
jgi:hypothetical protein